mgnify:FL=1
MLLKRKNQLFQKIHYQFHGQMSEAFLTAAFLSISGGLQDAYTYLFRGKVFANAQTGNIVLMSQCIYGHDLRGTIHYLIPLLSFAFGIAAAEWIRHACQSIKAIHWRQLVLLAEILLLLAVGLVPDRLSTMANALVSFSCAMQVQAFRKVNGHAFASTMCIGNMRSGTEAFCCYARTRDAGQLKKALRYWEIIFLFGLGAGLGGPFLPRFGAHTIWFSCLFLFMSLCLMFICEKPGEGG